MISLIPATLLFILTVSLVTAAVRKCLDDVNCNRDECCAQMYYLFRCEKRGYQIGDRCGLCGCANGLSCVAEGINPFKILSGRGVCRRQHLPTFPPSPPDVVTESEISSSTKRPQVPTTSKPNISATISGKDRFYEIFHPIYEQFIEAASKVAGVNLTEIAAKGP